jgi:hypothetical protein
MFEEANRPYDAIQQCVIVPGQALGKSFSVLLFGGGGEWELVGVPKRIDLQQLANFLSSRRVGVSSANFVPPDFTRPINLPVSLGLAAVGLMLLVGGLGFYAIKTVAPAGPNFVQAAPAPIAPQRQGPILDQGPPPPPVINNQAVAANAVNQVPPANAPGSKPAAVPTVPDRPRPNLQGFANPAVAPGQVEATPPGPAPAIPDRPAGAVRPVNAGANPAGRDTAVAGGQGGFPFRSASPTSQPMIGLAWTSGSWAGQKVIGRLEPLFNHDVPRGIQASVIAREGYVVGGVSVEGDDFVRAIQIVFVRSSADGRLDPTDAYASDWIGHPAGKKVQAIDSRGTVVIGIQGRRAAILDAVGLVLAEEM